MTYHFDDLMNEFSRDKAIYLIRHPLSNSLSRSRLGWSSYISEFSRSSKLKETLTKDALQLIERGKLRGDELDLMILSWCLENLMAIRAYQNKTLPVNTMLLRYEDLLVNPIDNLKNICRFYRNSLSPSYVKPAVQTFKRYCAQ